MDELGNDNPVENKMDVRRAVRQALFLGSAAALAGSLVLGGPAVAQDEDDDLEEVVVTGSRLARSGFDSATPMDVVNIRDAISLGFTDTASMLMSQPVLAGSNQMTAVLSGILGANGGEGVQTADLRGLGAGRTLSLLNGRRAGPAGIRDGVSSFDINVIPTAGLERVEILKDGASSIYGSDAIGGVINYITRRGDGGEINAYTQMSEESGGETLIINGSYGKETDRGYWRVTADYNKQEEILKGDRSVFDCEQNYIFNEPGLQTRADDIDPRTGDYKCVGWNAGSQWVYDYHPGTAHGTFPGGYNYYGYIPPGAGNAPNVTRTSTRVAYDYDGSIAASGLLPDRNNGAFDPAHLTVPEGWYILPDSPTGRAFRPTVGDLRDSEVMVPELERLTFMANGEFSISESVTVYAEALFNRRESSHQGLEELWSYNYTSDYSYVDYTYTYDYFYDYDAMEYVYYNYQYTYLFGPGGDPKSVGWGGAAILDPIMALDTGGVSTEVDYTRFVLGVKGDIGASNWSYDIAAQYSKSDGTYQDGVILADSRYYSSNLVPFWYGHSGDCASMTFDRYGPDAEVAGNGRDYIGGTVRETVQCVPVNFLDPETLRGNFTPEQRDFFFGIETGTTKYVNQSFDVGFANNELFTMPAGNFGLAAGVQLMTDEIADTPGLESLSGNVWDGTAGPAAAKQFGTYGETETQAAYIETAIPLLADTGIAQHLELNASARYTKVSIDETEDSAARDFTGDTYKIGLNWMINDSFRVRANKGTSFRTPGLFELYRKNFHSYPSQQTLDPCWGWGDALAGNQITQEVADNCASLGMPDNTASLISADVITGGGASILEPETSTSDSIGIIWAFQAIDLRMSVDYFSVEVNDQIGIGSANAIVEGCMSSETFPDDFRCDLFQREEPGVPVEQYRVKTVQSSYVNLDKQRTEGWDIEASYATELGNGMGLSFVTSHTIVTTRETENEDGVISSFNGRAGSPKWVGNLTTRLSKGDWAATWRVNFVDSTDQNSGRTTPLADSGTWTGANGQPVDFYYDRKLDSRTYHHLGFDYGFGSGWSTNLGVSNVTDEKPPRGSTNNLNIEGSGAFYSQYDWQGRRYSLNIKKEF
jgi:iron complex outermembrane receptor protein